ncbi:MAG TPA: 16S rRNA (guanine(527)-N(7))-methyltransferase RsmG [Alphaproteobacteria bacterium]|jgi:16S rRNA (guanine527-N7)-methyltransferase|nr:16S rRNA (guanine(527)-N(7))-methyltransferase RsmG [Alphaproteobacteria bacterium]
MRAEEFAELSGVSRETLERLTTYLELLRKWNGAINLVGASTLADPWRRHFWDSAQLLPLLPSARSVVVDLGSGGGFPGLVLAIAAGDRTNVHLVESDRRKATFLREAARATATEVAVHSERAETPSKPVKADVITARALAPISVVLELAAAFAQPETQFLLLKGSQTHNELTEARKHWTMTVDVHPSRSDASGFMVQIKRAIRHDRSIG